MRRLLFAVVIGAAMGGAAAPQAWAGDRAADVQKIEKGLESEAVRARLKALGLTEKDIETRMSKLSDAQVHKLAQDVESIRSGGAIGLLGAILLVLLIVILL